MAHYAKIDDNNNVLTVLALDNENELDENINVSESVGQNYLETHNDWPANKWIKTSFNTLGGKYYNQEEGTLHADQTKVFRGNYALIGGIWDPVNQIFLNQKPYNSWIVNVSEARWKSPIGDPPDLTNAQIAENQARTHSWFYDWDEAAYQADTSNPKTAGWNLTNSNN